VTIRKDREIIFFKLIFKGPDSDNETRRARAASTLPSPFKLQKQGDKEELSASAFLFEMLRNCKDPWKGGE
jgi:hypothetical protein